MRTTKSRTECIFQDLVFEMKKLGNLIENLKRSGIEFTKQIEEAMHKVDVEDFTDYDASGFYFDLSLIHI